MSAPARKPPANYYLAEGDEMGVPPRPRPRRGNGEAVIQVAIVRYLRLALPGAVIHASPNGAVLKGNPQERGIAMSRLKAAGMLVGFPDLIVLWRGQFWAFEVKQEGGRTSEAQAAVGAMIERNGGRWAVVRSVTDVEDCVREWRGALP